MPRILIVEDEKYLADALGGFFQAQLPETEVHIAYTVADAYEALKQPVDVLFTDYSLPDGTGADVAQAARTAYPHAAILLHTAYGAAPDIQQLQEDHIVNQILSKPCLPAEIFTAIRHYMTAPATA